MGSQGPLAIPMIDFSDLSVGCPKWNIVKAEVKQALEEYGFFEAIYPQIPKELRKALFSSLEELFDLPVETKQKNSSKKPFHGYVGQYPMVPLYESMGIDHALVPETLENFTNLLWPQGNDNFRDTLLSYATQLSELDKIVRRMVLESLDLMEYLDEHMDSTNYLLRVMKYKGPKTTDTKLGMNAHTDLNIVTILYQNQVEGLAVQTKDGVWLDVTPSHDSFTVMIGESLHAWTNGKLHPPYHRVMMKGDEPRYSAGLFSVPKPGYMIKAPEKLIDEEHPVLFKPFDHVKFLDFYYTEAGQRARDKALKNYCGV